MSWRWYPDGFTIQMTSDTKRGSLIRVKCLVIRCRYISSHACKHLARLVIDGCQLQIYSCCLGWLAHTNPKCICVMLNGTQIKHSQTHGNHTLRSKSTQNLFLWLKHNTSSTSKTHSHASWTSICLVAFIKQQFRVFIIDKCLRKPLRTPQVISSS